MPESPKPHAIMISPVDPECRLTEEEMAAIRFSVSQVKPGDVITVPVPVSVHHFVEGLWILSEDLPHFFLSPSSTESDDD
jgi:hypothetical protein